MEDYKINEHLIKNEENALLKTIILKNFHIHKIFESFKEKETNEIKLFKNNINYISKEIQNCYDIIGLNPNAKNKIINELVNTQNNKNNTLELKNKINKLYNYTLKLKSEFKNTYDNLLEEEILLNSELDLFNLKLNNNSNIDSNYNCKNIYNNENNYKSNNESTFVYNKESDNLNLIIEDILNNKTISLNCFPEDTLNNILNNISCKSVLKIYIDKLDNILDKNLKGNSLSWNSKDHDEFVKLAIQYKNKVNNFSFFDELISTLPYIPTSELKLHIKMYNKYLLILELKKLIIFKYKQLKNKEYDDKKELIVDIITKTEDQCNNYNISSNKMLAHINNFDIDNYIKKLNVDDINHNDNCIYFKYNNLKTSFDINSISKDNKDKTTCDCLLTINNNYFDNENKDDEDKYNYLYFNIHILKDKEIKSNIKKKVQLLKHKKKKENILIWKKQKLKEKTEKEQELKRKIEDNKIKEEIIRKNINIQNKLKIENSRKNKILCQQENTLKNIEDSKHEINIIDKLRIKERNEALLKNKKLAGLDKLKSVNNVNNYILESKHLLKKNNSNNLYDNSNIKSKLYENTTISKNKSRTKFNYNEFDKKEVSTMANNVLGKVGRKVPNWRLNL